MTILPETARRRKQHSQEPPAASDEQRYALAGRARRLSPPGTADDMMDSGRTGSLAADLARARRMPMGSND